jgi:2-keto-4-pentenoate hydratase/2-oxohepta-3-ene-1,7-dioic acid hydratase in catechol pathway
MRIARFTVGSEPSFGIVSADLSVIARIAGDPLFHEIKVTGQEFPLADVRLLAPVIPRSKIIGVGRNYSDHAEEFGNAVPAEPLLFLKPNTAVIGPGDPIVLPWQSHDVHFEGELAIVIGKMCRNITLAQAPSVIFGVTCANDVTARDLQKTDGQWSRAKGFDTFCPLGPWIETDPRPSAWQVSTEVDGQLKQNASTAELVHGIPQLVQQISQSFTLLPGDVILTGTPAGVGPLAAGERVRVRIEGLGYLENPVVAAER